MTSIDRRMLDRELKKGSAELIILSIVETRARHGYEISQQIEIRSAGKLKFHIASLYPLLYRLEERGWSRRVKAPGRDDVPATCASVIVRTNGHGNLARPREVICSHGALHVAVLGSARLRPNVRGDR